jgi:hypothetical protein
MTLGKAAQLTGTSTHTMRLLIDRGVVAYTRGSGWKHPFHITTSVEDLKAQLKIHAPNAGYRLAQRKRRVRIDTALPLISKPMIKHAAGQNALTTDLLTWLKLGDDARYLTLRLAEKYNTSRLKLLLEL